MITTSLAEIAAVVGGEVVGPEGAAATLVTGPAFLDSRSPVPGGLFVAVAGEHVDGHRYAENAVAGGAAAVLSTRPTGAPGVVVADAQAALQLLATHVLGRLRAADPHLRVVAVTGSHGKTSAKDLLAAVLADAEPDLGPSVATYGSFNNELGLPLTILRAGVGTRVLVLEMGARGVGHIAELCAIASPDIGVVLNVGHAHLGEFGSQERIARAKGEIVESLPADGTAILNLDDPLVAAMASRTRAPVLTFGRSVGAEVRLSSVAADELGRVRFDLEHGNGREHVRMRLIGEHQADNAAAAAAVALRLGVGLDRIARSLESVTALSRWRMELHERADGLVVINDAYNANPDSVRAALTTLADVGRRTGRPTIAVLGGMRELGDASADEHRAIGRFVAELGIGHLVVIGDDARAMHEANDTSEFHASVEDAIPAVRDNVLGTEVVLVKASRAGRLERVADALLGERRSEEVTDR